MGSFPSLPALGVNPATSPLEPVEKALSIRNLLAQGRTQQLQQEGLAQENEQRQIAINDQKAMTAAMQDWDGKDYNDLVPLVVKHGGSANAVMGLKKQILD